MPHPPQSTHIARDHRRARFDRLLLKIVDGALAGCIFVVPFLLGGRHPIGQLLLVGLAVAAALAWTVRLALRPERTWRFSAVELLLFAGAALLVLQMTPLPLPLVQRLAPRALEILPLWTAQADSPHQLGPWATVSLTPAATRDALVLFLAYSLLFLVTVQRIRDVEDVQRLLRWTALSALLTATFGLVQFLASNGKYFWVYEHPFANTSDAPKAAFGNRNHFAHFLALGVGPLIWWFQHNFRRRRGSGQGDFGRSVAASSRLALGPTFRVIALGTVLFAVLLSLSRGGAIVTCLAILIATAVCYRARSAGIRLLAGLSAAAVLIGACLTIFGHDRVSGRLDELAAVSIRTLDGVEARRTIWKATIKAIPDYLTLGSGQGSLREVYPMYLPWRQTYQYYTHCENGYLQIALETGIPGVVLLTIGIALCGFWCIRGLSSARSGRVLVCVGAVAASLAVSVVHSLVDFVWYNPACMALVAVLAACACRLAQLAAKDSGRHRAPMRFAMPLSVIAALLLLGVGAWMVRSRLGPVMAQSHWVGFQIQRRAALNLGHFDNMDLHAPREDARASLDAERSMETALKQVVRWNPHNASAHLQLAECYMRLFHRAQENSVNLMSLGQIRDAAIRSQFPSREALNEWLTRAVGQHYDYLDLALRHTRRALALCPLHGEGYLYLAELCFLDGAGAETKTACVAQALKVRPFDGAVLFHAGKEAYLQADHQRWLDCWKRSFDAGPIYQQQIIDWLTGRTPQEHLHLEIRFFLDTFRPDLLALRYLHRRYREIASREQMVALRQAYRTALEAEAENTPPPAAADLWLEALSVSTEAGDRDAAASCARKAFQAAPASLPVRRRLAECLVAQQQFAEAEVHLKWCLKQQPGHVVLQNMLREVVKSQIGHVDRAAAPGSWPRYR